MYICMHVYVYIACIQTCMYARTSTRGAFSVCVRVLFICEGACEFPRKNLRCVFFGEKNSPRILEHPVANSSCSWLRLGIYGREEKQH